MSTKLTVSFLCILISGCASQERVRILSPFDKMATAALLAPGKNTIAGSGLIRQKGGGVVTCAGLKVLLIPTTNYSVERIRAIFKDSTHANLPLYRREPSFDPDPIEYAQLTKESTCDAQGNFEFSNLSDGQFFLISKIYWQVSDNNMQGSVIMRRVNAFDGATVKVVLSP